MAMFQRHFVHHNKRNLRQRGLQITVDGARLRSRLNDVFFRLEWLHRVSLKERPRSSVLLIEQKFPVTNPYRRLRPVWRPGFSVVRDLMPKTPRANFLPPAPTAPLL